MCLASGGYSKMSCFNAQILLRGPRAFFFFGTEKSAVFLVPCASVSDSMVVHPLLQRACVFPMGVHSTASYFCIAYKHASSPSPS